MSEKKRDSGKITKERKGNQKTITVPLTIHHVTHDSACQHSGAMSAEQHRKIMDDLIREHKKELKKQEVEAESLVFDKLHKEIKMITSDQGFSNKEVDLMNSHFSALQRDFGHHSTSQFPMLMKLLQIQIENRPPTQDVPRESYFNWSNWRFM